MAAAHGHRDCCSSGQPVVPIKNYLIKRNNLYGTRHFSPVAVMRTRARTGFARSTMPHTCVPSCIATITFRLAYALFDAVVIVCGAFVSLLILSATVHDVCPKMFRAIVLKAVPWDLYILLPAPFAFRSLSGKK